VASWLAPGQQQPGPADAATEARLSAEDDPDAVHIFTIASGHMYERLQKIMILSVLRNTGVTGGAGRDFKPALRRGRHPAGRSRLVVVAARVARQRQRPARRRGCAGAAQFGRRWRRRQRRAAQGAGRGKRTCGGAGAPRQLRRRL